METDDVEPVNIVMLIADAIGFDAYHGMENLLPDEQLPAATLRKLARNGVQFREATVHTSASMPSRAAMLTGCSAHSSGYLLPRTLVPASKAEESQCTSMVTTLNGLNYDTSFLDAIGSRILGGNSGDASTASRKQLRSDIAMSNRAYWRWMAEVEPKVTDLDFFKNAKSNVPNANQKTGTIAFGNSIQVPFAQVVELPEDLLEAISRASSIPSVMDFAEERTSLRREDDNGVNVRAKTENNGDLPAWALFGTTSLPPSLSRSAFVANQTIRFLEEMVERRKQQHGLSESPGNSKDRPFAVVASFVDPVAPWLVSGQTYNSLFGSLENGVASLPDLQVTPLPKFLMREKSERSLTKRVSSFLGKNRMRAKYLTALYYTKVKAINNAVAEILDSMERLSITDSTLVRYVT